MPDRKRAYHGVSIGILMLDTRFTRFNGDIGNARTWPFPVQYRIVRDATPNRVTRPEGPDMLDAFKAAATEMIDAGMDGITTTCGFLGLYQKELVAHCAVPVATSSLLQVPMRDITRLTELPVFDIVTLVHWFHRSLSPERFAQD